MRYFLLQDKGAQQIPCTHDCEMFVSLLSTQMANSRNLKSVHRIFPDNTILHALALAGRHMAQKVIDMKERGEISTYNIIGGETLYAIPFDVFVNDGEDGDDDLIICVPDNRFDEFKNALQGDTIDGFVKLIDEALANEKIAPALDAYKETFQKMMSGAWDVFHEEMRKHIK